MTFCADEIRELATQFPGTEQASEGGVTYFRVPPVDLPDGCTPSKASLLLRPSAIGGYAYRLYLSERVTTPATKNWQPTEHILGQTWHCFSWQATQSVTLIQMVARLLGALVCP